MKVKAKVKAVCAVGTRPPVRTYLFGLQLPSQGIALSQRGILVAERQSMFVGQLIVSEGERILLRCLPRCEPSSRCGAGNGRVRQGHRLLLLLLARSALVSASVSGPVQGQGQHVDGYVRQRLGLG